MIRACWIAAVAGVVGLAGYGGAQTISSERVISVKELDKPAQKCRVIKCWTEKDGSRVCQVQVIATGEMMTIQESGPTQAAQASPGGFKALTTRIFHWGKGSAPPEGVPAAPKDAVVVGQPSGVPGGATPAAPRKRLGLFAWGRDKDETPARAERWSTEDANRGQSEAARKGDFASSG